ncbi:MAG: HgcAB-associated protein [Methanomicrobiales archaeon]|nr:HgcAB-associated protein [Methanomicrobiales archaeon]
MPSTIETDESCGTCGGGSRCRIEAVLTIDERGQMVLPKDVRERAGLHSGDKLALISWEQNGKVCCLALMKADALSGMVQGLISPLLNTSQGHEVK